MASRRRLVSCNGSVINVSIMDANLCKLHAPNLRKSGLCCSRCASSPSPATTVSAHARLGGWVAGVDERVSGRHRSVSLVRSSPSYVHSSGAAFQASRVGALNRRDVQGAAHRFRNAIRGVCPADQGRDVPPPSVGGFGSGVMLGEDRSCGRA